MATVNRVRDVSEDDRKAFFDALDTDKDGRITLQEFKKFLVKFLPPEELPSDQLATDMFCAADKDGSGTITLDEIHAIMQMQ